MFSRVQMMLPDRMTKSSKTKPKVQKITRKNAASAKNHRNQKVPQKSRPKLPSLKNRSPKSRTASHPRVAR